MTDTIAAIATGAGVSAIGIIRLSGPESIKAVHQLFRPYGAKGMLQAEPRKLYYGKLFSTEKTLMDMCLCTISHAPDSYTGEDTAELQCHGSPVLLRLILDELFKLGVRQAGPGEFTKRAFLNGKMDLSSAEAVIDLIDAETNEAAKNAAGQLAGAIYRKTDAIYRTLADISAHYHAVLDYPDEDIEDFQITEYAGAISTAAAELEKLLATFERGKYMRQGIPAAIIGLPNAGKSSLLNRLLGYDRAIVTNIPGTTRDTIEERVKFGNITLRLTDTAGLHETDDPVEKLGVQRSLAAMEQAELVIAVVDGTEAVTPEVSALIRQAEQAKKGIVVLSKADIAAGLPALETTLPIVAVSSVTGDGLGDLEAAVAQAFPSAVVPAGEILTNARHADAVLRAVDYLKAAIDAMRANMTPDIILTETEGAMEALGELTGKTVRNDITNTIFSRFCVGK